jgi:hypothetical protein
MPMPGNIGKMPYRLLFLVILKMKILSKFVEKLLNPSNDKPLGNFLPQCGKKELTLSFK